MQTKPIDLNLFVVFQAIYQTRSVTLAGRRLSMTQSAVSNALKRTREQFGDELFVRTPSGMVPTPLAERLIGPTMSGLSQFSRAIDNGTAFDPAKSERQFRLAINDVGQLAMMPALIEATRTRAPAISFETVECSFPEGRHRMSSGQLDLALGSWEALGSGFRERTLFAESFVVLMSANHKLARTTLSFDDYLAADHIAYSPSGATLHALQQTLNKAGVANQRKIVLTAAHSLGLSSIVASSDLLLTAPSRLARAMAVARNDLLIQPTPFDVIPFSIRLHWHERFEGDSGNRWLRELVVGLFYQSPARGHDRIANRDMDVPA